MKLHYIAIRMAKMKKSDKILRADKDVEQLEISFICWKKEKQQTRFRKLQKSEKIYTYKELHVNAQRLTYDSRIYIRMLQQPQTEIKKKPNKLING